MVNDETQEGNIDIQNNIHRNGITYQKEDKEIFKQANRYDSTRKQSRNPHKLY